MGRQVDKMHLLPQTLQNYIRCLISDILSIEKRIEARVKEERDAARWNNLHVGMLASGDWHKKQRNKLCDGTTQ